MIQSPSRSATQYRTLGVFGLILWLFTGHLKLEAQMTFLADLSTSPTDTERLFLDSAGTIIAPVNTFFWLVADQSGSGLSTQLYGEGGPDGYPPEGMESITDAQVTNIINGTGNDHRFYVGQIDGTLVGDQPGKINQPGIEVSSDYENSRIYLYLWNDVNANSVIGDEGDTFGLFDFGVSPPPAGGLGNATYVVDDDVYADRIAITAVPEPEAYAFVFSMAVLGWVLWHRVDGRKSKIIA